jgi:hypothetical protein
VSANTILKSLTFPFMKRFNFSNSHTRMCARVNVDRSESARFGERVVAETGKPGLTNEYSNMSLLGIPNPAIHLHRCCDDVEGKFNGKSALGGAWIRRIV